MSLFPQLGQVMIYLFDLSTDGSSLKNPSPPVLRGCAGSAWYRSNSVGNLRCDRPCKSYGSHPASSAESYQIGNKPALKGPLDHDVGIYDLPLICQRSVTDLSRGSNCFPREFRVPSRAFVEQPVSSFFRTLLLSLLFLFVFWYLRCLSTETF